MVFGLSVIVLGGSCAGVNREQDTVERYRDVAVQSYDKLLMLVRSYESKQLTFPVAIAGNWQVANATKDRFGNYYFIISSDTFANSGFLLRPLEQMPIAGDGIEPKIVFMQHLTRNVYLYRSQ